MRGRWLPVPANRRTAARLTGTLHSSASVRLPQTGGAICPPAGAGRIPPATGAGDGSSRTAPENSAAPCAGTSVPRFPAAAGGGWAALPGSSRSQRGWRSPAPT